MRTVCSTHRAASCPASQPFSAHAATLGIRTHVSEQDLSHRDINLVRGEPGRYTATVDAFIHSLWRSR